MSVVCDPGGEDQAARVLQSAVPSATRGMGGCAYCPASPLKSQRPSAVCLGRRGQWQWQAVGRARREQRATRRTRSSLAARHVNRGERLSVRAARRAAAGASGEGLDGGDSVCGVYPISISRRAGQIIEPQTYQLSAGQEWCGGKARTLQAHDRFTRVALLHFFQTHARVCPANCALLADEPRPTRAKVVSIATLSARSPVA
jgi:hypothetical protein